MPYIAKNLREQLNPHLDEVVRLLREVGYDRIDGALNYTLSYITAASMRPETGWRYAVIARAHGALLAAAAEFYRRIAAPYENRARSSNGDIEPYKHDF